MPQSDRHSHLKQQQQQQQYVVVTMAWLVVSLSKHPTGNEFSHNQQHYTVQSFFLFCRPLPPIGA